MVTHRFSLVAVVVLCIGLSGIACEETSGPNGQVEPDVGMEDADPGALPPNASYSNYYTGSLDSVLLPDGDGLFDISASMVVWEQDGQLLGSLQFGSDSSDLVLWSHTVAGTHEDDGSVSLSLGVPDCRERAADICGSSDGDAAVGLTGEGQLDQKAIVVDEFVAQTRVFGQPSSSVPMNKLRLEPTSYHQTHPVGAGDDWQPQAEGRWEGGAVGLPGADRVRVAGLGCSLELERRIGELHLDAFDCGAIGSAELVDGSFLYEKGRLMWRTDVGGTSYAWVGAVEEGGLSGVVLPESALAGEMTESPPELRMLDAADVQGAFSLNRPSEGM